jgi:hypothetical protein
MPLYDVECVKCKQVQEIFCCIKDRESYIINHRCTKCKGKVKQVITNKGRDWFRVHINEDFDGTPIEVTSKKHYKELCKKFKVQARALL